MITLLSNRMQNKKTMKNKFERIVRFFLSLNILKKYNYLLLDSVFTEARRILFKNNNWRFGHDRTNLVVNEFMEYLNKYTSVKDKTYLDLGCGKHHPFGHSAIMYLNGAKKTIAFDLDKYDDNSRASEALYDLLADCALNRKKWMVTNDNSEKDFISRIDSFDSDKLRLGNLSGGIKKNPLNHIQGNIENIDIPDNSIDILTSKSVLEHFLNFEAAMKNYYRFMASNSYSFHSIDLVDHRAYKNKNKYNYWSFLTENEEWTDNLCNRLRSSEIKEIFEKVGFKVLEWDEIKRPLPQKLRIKLKGRFKDMSDDELSVIGVKCILFKEG